MTRTASGGIVIVRRYAGGANYDHEVSGTFGTDAGIAGVTAPSLVPPIDFEAELAERDRTREPLEPTETDLTNADFGI